MLVLTRRPGEQILIGDDVSLSVVRVAGNRVRLGISAPQRIPVQRQEIGARRCPERVEEAQLSVVGATTNRFHG